jgi:hypothetical protein
MAIDTAMMSLSSSPCRSLFDKHHCFNEPVSLYTYTYNNCYIVIKNHIMPCTQVQL